MKTKLTLLLFASAVIFLASCSKYPPTSDRLLEDLAIITQYDVNYIKTDFSMYKTFSVSPAVMKVTDTDTTILTGAGATAAVEEVTKEMISRGFVQSTGEQKPDLGISIVYFQNTYVYSYYPDYYWGYPYYGYGWYYPYYPVYYSSYTAGMANIMMVDLKNPGVNNTLYIRWNAYIRGLLTGEHTVADITNAIDQAFIQTPQLVTTAN